MDLFVKGNDWSPVGLEIVPFFLQFRGGGGGGGEQAPNPFPFSITFLIEKANLKYTFHKQLYPFRIPTVETLTETLHPGF